MTTGQAPQARRRGGLARIPVGIPAATILAFSAPALLLRRARRPADQPARTRRGARRPPTIRLPRIRGAAVAAFITWAVAAVTLFVVYLHAARTSAVTSDGASNALQAWDILHGNVLLRGWQLSDVSFYPTELGQYVLIEWMRGLGPDVVHVAAAMTYALLVLLAALLAKGRTTGREAIVRCVLAAGIMLAPQAGNGISVLMGSPDHTGSAVPVLLTFLLVDRAPRRWYTAPVACVLLTAGLVADPIVLFTGVLPMLAVVILRVWGSGASPGGRPPGTPRRKQWRDMWPEFALGASAAAATVLGRTALAMIASRGGFRVWPVAPALVTPAELARSITVTGRGFLVLFGADFLGDRVGLVAALAFAHLAGLALAAWATCATIRRLYRLGGTTPRNPPSYRLGGTTPPIPPSGADAAAALLAAGIVITLAAYVLSTRATALASTRDITAVLPFGAALAGRTLPARLAAARLLPALAIVLACYLVSLGRVVTQPPAQPQNAALGRWLAAHHLGYGLGGYWDANVTTLASGGRVELRPVLAHGSQITSDYWEVKAGWFDPAARYANFIVLVQAPPGFKRYPTVASVRRTFGQPARIYELKNYTIVIFNKNLLADLVRGGPLPPRTRSGPPPARPLPAPPGQ